MVQKPVQDIYTCVLLVSFAVLIVLGGIQAAGVLQQAGFAPVTASTVTLSADSKDTLDEGVLVYEEVSVKECEVIYHRVSQGGVYLDGYPHLAADREKSFAGETLYAAAEEEQHDAGDLYYALYSCNGAAVMADGYI